MCVGIHSHVCTCGQRKTVRSFFKSHTPLFKTKSLIGLLEAVRFI